jgi:hypothetical protein
MAWGWELTADILCVLGIHPALTAHPIVFCLFALTPLANLHRFLICIFIFGVTPLAGSILLHLLFISVRVILFNLCLFYIMPTFFGMHLGHKTTSAVTQTVYNVQHDKGALSEQPLWQTCKETTVLKCSCLPWIVVNSMLSLSQCGFYLWLQALAHTSQIHSPQLSQSMVM